MLTWTETRRERRGGRVRERRAAAGKAATRRRNPNAVGYPAPGGQSGRKAIGREKGGGGRHPANPELRIEGPTHTSLVPPPPPFPPPPPPPPRRGNSASPTGHPPTPRLQPAQGPHLELSLGRPVPPPPLGAPQVQWVHPSHISSERAFPPAPATPAADVHAFPAGPQTPPTLRLVIPPPPPHSTRLQLCGMSSPRFPFASQGLCPSPNPGPGWGCGGELGPAVITAGPFEVSSRNTRAGSHCARCMELKCRHPPLL